MAQGQGASMALPIYGKYISKVYADRTLPYKQTAKFVMPTDISLCDREYYGEEEVEETEESVEGVFD
jgi:penicillin-binding protein 1A